METKTNSPMKAPFQMSFAEWLATYGERLTEAKERRSEMGKVFQLGENHFRTVIYPEAVHYWDASNKMYRSIDNRLVQLSDGLRNAANGKLQVQLKENLVQLANDRQQEISWQLVQGRKVAPKQNLQQKMESLFGKLLGTEHQLESEAVYEGILPGVDWRCKIQGEQFKDENVFPALEQVQPVQFRLRTNGLTLVQDEAEAMHLADAQGEPAFYLPAPYAISAEEEQEYGPVAVQVTQESEDSWLLTYTISESWLAQAVFPVRLDPAVMTYNARCAIDDAYTCSKQAGTVHKGSSSNILRLTQGSSNWGKCNCYFKFDNKVTFNGTAYAYLYNLQGDVIALIDSNGKKVVEYKYDAWGRILSKTGTMASTLGTLNPFRYRGYVYDEETGLYYLRSRYYNPEWARFLNADSHLGFRGELLAHNVYTYCVNAPVGLLDEDGLAWTMGVYEPYYGFYHREVQRWIADHNNGVVMEVSTSTGRIDLYNVRSTEIYEVKPNRSYHIEMGKRQLERYMQGNLSTRMGDACQLILPPDGTLSYEYKNVIVDISVRAEGSLVLYSARQTYKRKKQTVSVHAAVPAREKERNEQFALQPVWGTVLRVSVLLIGAVTPWPGDEVMGWTLILAP